MAKTNQRQRAKARRTRRRKKQVDSAPESVTHRTAQQKIGTDPDMSEDRQERETSILTHAVRAVGIAPITLLVVILGSHQLYPGAIPIWFRPILDKQIAVLTLSAGHAGIIGLLISNRGRSTWSTFRAADRCHGDSISRVPNDRREHGRPIRCPNTCPTDLPRSLARTVERQDTTVLGICTNTERHLDHLACGGCCWDSLLPVSVRELH